MRLRDLQIGTHSDVLGIRELNKDSWCISSHYLSKFRGFETGKIGKAYVALVAEIPKRIGKYDPAGGLYRVYRTFDFESYLTLAPQAKKVTLLKELHAGLLEIAEKSGWPSEPFEEAYQAVLADNLLYREFWKKPKWNKSRSMRGQVHFCFDIDRLDFHAVAFDKAGEEIARRLLVSFPRAIDMDHYDTLDKYGWLDNNTFYLESKQGWMRWAVELPGSAADEVVVTYENRK